MVKLYTHYLNQLQDISNHSRGQFVLSNIKRYERKSFSGRPSVKMVLSGNENYNVDGHRYNLHHGSFLVVDNDNWVEILVDARKEVKGICIFPEKKLLNEVAKTRLSTCQSLLDSPFETDDISLVHNLFNCKDNRTGRFLIKNISTIIQLQERKKSIDFEDFYAGLAECLIDDQLELQGQLRNIPCIKRTTKEELYRRVAVARNFIADNYSLKMSLDDLAQEAFLSKYHFTRTFKLLFGMSPYQYLLGRRLEKAEELLAQNYSYSKVSDLVGFSDSKNLRKALKKIKRNNY